MSFDAFDASLELVKQLRRSVAQLETRDRDLALQLRRAASSVALNINEGRRRTGKDRTHLWRVAAGSANEVKAALQVAEAWGHLDGDAIVGALAVLDRVLAMLWRMTH